MPGLFAPTRCGSCGIRFRRTAFTWEIDGRTLHLCPNCNRRMEQKKSSQAVADLLAGGEPSPPPPRRWLAQAVFYVGLVAVAGWWLFYGSHREAPPRVTTEPSPGSEAPVPIATASAPTPTPPAAGEAFARAVRQSQAAAVVRFPALGQKDSPLNLRFRVGLEEWRARGDVRLTKPDWPERLAETCTAEPGR